jgi:hypothetical protein
MEFRSYPLNAKLLKQQKRSAKIYAEKEFSDEVDDVFTLSSRIIILSGVDERVPRDPNCGSPSNEGNISEEIGIDVRDMATMISPIRPQTYRAPRASQCSAGHRPQQRRPCVSRCWAKSSY